MSIQIAVLSIAYIFIVMPTIGRLAVIGGTTKKHWSGYQYEACLERGVKIHISIAALILIFWALFTV